MVKICFNNLLTNCFNNLLINCVDLIDLIGIIFLLLFGLRLYLFNWYFQLIVCLYVVYQLYQEGYKQIISEISYFTEFCKISNIFLKFIKYVKIDFNMIRNFSITNIMKIIIDYFLQEIKNWIKYTICDKFSNLVFPFIKAKVINWVKTKCIEFIKNIYEENKSKIIKTI